MPVLLDRTGWNSFRKDRHVTSFAITFCEALCHEAVLYWGELKDLIRYLWPSLRSHLLVYRKSYVTWNRNTPWQSLPACFMTYLNVVPRQRYVSSASSHKTACFTSRTCSRGFRFFGVFAKLRKATVTSSCLSVRPYAWNNSVFHRTDLQEIWHEFIENCRENSSFIKIWQE
jgi:hypothetical protein